MSSCVGPRATRRCRLLRVAATVLIVFGLASVALAAPSAADRNQCAPGGVDSATVLPKNLTESGGMGQDDEHTTATVEPLSSVNIGALRLDTPAC
jgi:polar amino acid transport system substrate-binding protein